MNRKFRNPFIILAAVFGLFSTTILFNPLSAQIPVAVPQRAAPVERELLDSLVYLETYQGDIYNGDKEAWTYGSDGLTEQYSWYYWDTGTEAWKGRQRLDSTFNASGRLSMLIKDRWDNQTGQWKQERKSELSYDSEGALVLYVDYVWNAETNEWVYISKTESTHAYTETGMHILISINYTYDNDNGSWAIHHQNEINFDANGKQTLYNASFYDVESSSWVFKTGSFMYENAYNEQGQQTLRSYYIWDSGINQWKGQGDLVESGYDANGQLTSVVTKAWDVSSNQWVNKGKTENRYNDQEVVTEILKAEWDMEENGWVVVSKQAILYNAHGNVLNDQLLLLDTLSKAWYTATKDTFTYDLNNREILIEHWERKDEGRLVLYNKRETAYDTHGNVLLTTFSILDVQSGTFVTSYDTRYTYNESGEKLIEEATAYYYDAGPPYIIKRTYYYSMHSVSSIDTEQEGQRPLVYPSIFTDQLSFQLNNTQKPCVFELFNAQGQKVFSKRVDDAEAINVASLRRGVYVYTLSFDGNVFKGKIIKK